MKQHRILCTKLLTKELMKTSQIRHVNRKLMSQHANRFLSRPKPRFIGFIKYKAPRDFIDLHTKKETSTFVYKNVECSMEPEIRHTTENVVNCVGFCCVHNKCVLIYLPFHYLTLFN